MGSDCTVDICNSKYFIQKETQIQNQDLFLISHVDGARNQSGGLPFRKRGTEKYFEKSVLRACKRGIKLTERKGVAMQFATKEFLIFCETLLASSLVSHSQSKMHFFPTLQTGGNNKNYTIIFAEKMRMYK